MKQNRIFIENLPETATESEISSKFTKYGDVISIEIKERKVVTAKHSSCFFAYVNLKTDDSSLQRCFQSFNETPWCGQYVKIQIAKESFLERLKRERETNASKTESENTQNQPPFENIKSAVTNTATTTKKNAVDTISSVTVSGGSKKRKLETQSNESSSSDSSSEEETVSAKKITTKVEKEKSFRKSEVDKTSPIKENEEPDNEFMLLKKAHKGAKFINGRLKIEDFGKTPIFSSQSTEAKKLDERQAEAEARRKKAVQEKIRAYHQQKKAFTSFVTKPKIIRFTDSDNETKENENFECGDKKKTQKNNLLLSDSEDDFDVEQVTDNIEKRIKSDDRFALDHRFEDDEEDESAQQNKEDEGEQNLKILEEVLGKKIHTKKNQNENRPRYLRYDPTNPEHSKYVIENKDEPKTKKKTKPVNEKKAEEKAAPEVSKETEYSVNVDFKTILGNSSGFSLSAMFGDSTKKEEKTEEETTPITFQSLNEKNPFRYESSDDEDEIKDLQEEKKPAQPPKPKKMWTEPLFSQDNDFRVQDSLDFVKRTASLKREDDQFEQERKRFLQIVKKKMRNVQKKSKPFKKKLGGSKKKKMKRVDKALKR